VRPRGARWAARAERRGARSGHCPPRRPQRLAAGFGEQLARVDPGVVPPEPVLSFPQSNSCSWGAVRVDRAAARLGLGLGLLDFAINFCELTHDIDQAEVSGDVGSVEAAQFASPRA